MKSTLGSGVTSTIRNQPKKSSQSIFGLQDYIERDELDKKKSFLDRAMHDLDFYLLTQTWCAPFPTTSSRIASDSPTSPAAI